MKVVVIAAGRSKRLNPIEDKNLLEFLGKPLIQHQIEQLESAGFDDFIVVGGAHNLSKLTKLADNLPQKIEVVEQKDLDDGQAGGVLAVKSLVNDDPMLVVSANDVVDSKAFDLISNDSKNDDLDGLIVGKQVDSYFPGGYLCTNNDGLITSIQEKPGEGNEPSNMVNIVIHYFKKGSVIFESIENSTSNHDDRYEVALDNLMKNEVKIKALPYDGFWQPVKYPWHILEVMEYFLGKIEEPSIQKNVEVAESAVIKGNVYLDEGVKIFDQAVIMGPAYIGKNSVVASGALVRGSNVGSNSVVGYATEIARSYLGNDVWTHSNYIGDSIISDNCSFGAGCVTGNLRLDEGNIKVKIKDEKADSGRNKFGLITGPNVRCGINTSFMPGIKIGHESMIGAGIIIAEDVDNNKFVYGKTELVIKENTAKLDEKKREEMKNNLT